MPEERIDQTGTTMEDRAWQDMLNRLDASMPVQKGLTQRERIMLIALLLLLLVMGTYVIFNETNIEDPPTKTLPTDGNYALKHSETTIPTHLNQDSEVNKTSKSESARGKNRLNSSTKLGSDIFLDKRINSNDFVEGRALLQYAMISPRVFELITPGSYPEWPEQAGYLQPTLRRVTGGMELPGFHNEGILVEQNTTFLMDATPEPVFRDLKKQCMNSYGLSSAFFSENLTSFGGAEASLEYYRKLNRHITLQTGLALQMFSKNGFSNSLALSTFNNYGKPIPNVTPSRESWVEKRYEYEVQNSEIINNEIGAEYLTGIVDRLYYLTLPVNLMYRIHRFSFFAGANASLLLKGTNLTYDYENQYFNTVVLSKSVLEKRNYFNRVDIGLQAGLQVKLHKNLHLYSNYNYGLFKIVSAESAEKNNTSFRDNFQSIYGRSQRIDYNRYFTLGLRYMIYPCDW